MCSFSIVLHTSPPSPSYQVGGGGFFLVCEDFGENVQAFISRLRLFFKAEISTRTQSIVAQRAERTVADFSLTICL